MSGQRSISPSWYRVESDYGFTPAKIDCFTLRVIDRRHDEQTLRIEQMACIERFSSRQVFVQSMIKSKSVDIRALPSCDRRKLPADDRRRIS